MSKLTFNGYHGTSRKAAMQIVSANYEFSIGDKEWLGDGVYFFIEGLNSNPNSQAEEWAKAQSWDKNLKLNKYNEYCVLQTLIQVSDENLLDLNKEEGIEILEYLYERFEKKINTLKKRLEPIDGLLINLAIKEDVLPIDVVKGNFYIKFARERIKRINLRTPNSTICSVVNPQKCLSDTKIIKSGEVKK